MTFTRILFQLWAAMLASFATPAFALNQAEALAEAAAVNRQGSDESLQNSTTSAMRAMLELDKQNRPGALKNGYKSFGEYRTSQDLDIVRMRNRIRQIDLFTNNVKIGMPVPPWARSREDYATTFRRLDPKFLREGEAGEVADEFERRSGMRRETFLKKMAQASESTISADDPQLTEKVMSRFASFVDEIPNEEFRNNVKKQIEAVSPKSQASLIRDGAKRIWDTLASYGISAGARVVAIIPENNREPSARMPASDAAVDSPVAVGGQAVAALPQSSSPFSKESFSQHMAPRDADLKNLNFKANPMGAAMQAALEEEKDTTIFKQVSKRYRAMAPQLGIVKP